VWFTESPLLKYPKVDRFKGEESIDLTLLNQVLIPNKF